MHRVAWFIVVAVVTAVIGYGAGYAVGDDDDGERAAAPAAGDDVSDVSDVTEITRTPLGEASPANAPGQTLYLQQVVIPAHTALSQHFHDGTQVARVVEGTLTYDIESGTAAITRADGSTEEIDGPATTTLEAGDAIVETAALVHHGQNDGDEPVVVELAALLASGAPVATPVGEGADGTPLRVETDLESIDRTLHEAGADGTAVYGWNHLTGTSEVDGDEVTVEVLASVTYRAGNGPFFGMITFTFADGSTLATVMQGVTEASADGSNASFAASLGVFDGTGAYEGATGTGTFTGTRDASLGTMVSGVFDLVLTDAP